jgi:uncharacterized protein (TIGR02117 family)
LSVQKKKIKKILRILLRTVLFVAGFFVLYVLAGLTIPYISVNKNAAQNGADGYEMYILSNGVHTDLVVPLRTEVKDWTKALSFENTVSKDTAMHYVGFGWGDKGFYLNTPTWADLKTSTAFNAMFGLSTSAMHVTFHRQLVQGKLCRKTWVNKADYQKLVSFIEQSFQRDANGKFMYISGYAYGQDDGFYEAHRVYNLFYTCNTWANTGLKKANMKACLWTPLDKGILRLYE